MFNHWKLVPRLKDIDENGLEIEAWFEPKEDYYFIKIRRPELKGKSGILLKISAEDLENTLQVIPEAAEYPIVRILNVQK
jgi:hypothetical protein